MSLPLLPGWARSLKMSKKTTPVTTPISHLPLDQAVYWKEEAKKCIEARDQAKQRLNEVNQKLAELESQGSLNNHLNKFIREVPCEVNFRKEVSIHYWLMDQVCKIEETNHVPVRMECNATIIRHLRDMGTSVFSPPPSRVKIEDGCMGEIDPIGPVYLNNSINKKIRFFVKPITLSPFEFPCEPPRQDFKDEISHIINGIYATISSIYPSVEFIISCEQKKTAARVIVRNVAEFAEKMEDIKLSLLKELKANNATCTTYPEVFISSDPKLLQHDVSILVSFSSKCLA